MRIRINSLEGARQAGRFVGADFAFGAWMCPWSPGRHQAARNAWLDGFSQGRIARFRLEDAGWPSVEISLPGLRGGQGG